MDSNAPIRPAPAKEANVANVKADLSPRERAAARAAEILANNNGDLDDGTDEFAIDRDIIPDGWDYEWKTHMVMGATDPAKETSLRKKGWEPVPSGRHPELMPLGTPPGAPILRKGMMLMERPLVLTEQQRELDYRRARAQVSIKEQGLREAPPGTLDREVKGVDLIKVKKSFEKMEIPE